MRFIFLLFILCFNAAFASTEDEVESKSSAAVVPTIGVELSEAQMAAQKDMLSHVESLQTFLRLLREPSNLKNAVEAAHQKTVRTHPTIKKVLQEEVSIEILTEMSAEILSARISATHDLENKIKSLSSDPNSWTNAMSTIFSRECVIIESMISMSKTRRGLSPAEEASKDFADNFDRSISPKLLHALSAMKILALPFCPENVQKIIKGISTLDVKPGSQSSFRTKEGVTLISRFPGLEIGIKSPYWEVSEDTPTFVSPITDRTPVGILNISGLRIAMPCPGYDKPKQRAEVKKFEDSLKTINDQVKAHVKAPNEEGVYIFDLEVEKKLPKQKKKGKKGNGSAKKKVAKRPTAGAGARSAGAGSASAEAVEEAGAAAGAGTEPEAPTAIVIEDDIPTEGNAYDLKNWILAAVARQQREDAWKQRVILDRSESVSRPALEPEHKAMLEAFISGNQTNWHKYKWTDIVQTIQGLGGFTPSLNSGEFILNDHRFILHYIHSDGQRVYPTFVRGFLIPALERAGVIRTNEADARELAV